MLKAKVFSVAHPSVDALKTSLLREWVKIPKEMIRVSVDNFRQSIKIFQFNLKLVFFFQVCAPV